MVVVSGGGVDPAVRVPLRDLFVRLARRHGRTAQWRSFIGGTLGAPPAAVDALAAAPAPRTDAECGTLALRYGIDGWLLRRVVGAAQSPPAV